MTLELNKSYFVVRNHVYLREGPGTGKKVNHLLLGDWLRWRGQTDGEWEAVRCRGTNGWLKRTDFSATRALEVNFVDIGQGDGCHIVTPDDDILLIDAGVGSNMERFLSWRYNLRGRNVARAPDFDPGETVKEPWTIDDVLISHPDNDHYLGLLPIFKNPKLQFKRIWHNGIAERPPEPEEPGLTYPDDLGGYFTVGDERYVWNMVHDDAGMKALAAAHPTTRKQFLTTIRACIENSPAAEFRSVSVGLEDLGAVTHFAGFDGSVGGLALRVLGPALEAISRDGETRRCARALGQEDKTKNGHSVILMLELGALRVMLGGDLNTQAQDFLLRHYTGVDAETSKLEKTVARLRSKGDTLSTSQQQKLAEAEATLASIVEAARPVFGCDVTKACHHGSAHFVDTFLKAQNAAATVISSGDQEGHAHPRPDALGAFGKHGRGARPLIFSTELARSTREFTPVIKFLDLLRQFEADLAAATTDAERSRIQREMEKRKDRNVAVYGMITLRALGDRVVIAQKLEEPKKSGAKWDIHEMAFNPALGQFEVEGH